MKTLVIGAGQVGQAIFDIVSTHHDTHLRDIEPGTGTGYEVLQICYPDHADFVKTTQDYIDYYKPIFTIINSSVKVGTTSLCGLNVIYSPVRGRHPQLASEMRKFVKFVAGPNPYIGLARDYFKQCGLRVSVSLNPDELELLKLVSNIHMGLEIAWRQEVDRMLKKFHVSETIYEDWEKTYANGYFMLGQSHLMRPLMRPDPIGGHCILECTKLLQSQFPSKAFDFIQESNEKRKEESSWDGLKASHEKVTLTVL